MAFNQDELERFLKALAADRSPLGLVVTDHDAKSFILPSVAPSLASLDIDVETDPDAVLSLLIDCAKRKRWCRMNLLSGTFPGRLYNQLRGLSSSGHMDIVQLGVKGREVELRWPMEAKIILVVNAVDLENISIPTFLNLFGPILR